jgi:hypothetical protein
MEIGWIHGTALAPDRLETTGRCFVNRGEPNRPPVSYVLAALTRDEVHNAASWLRDNSVSDQVEIVLAAPARALAQVPSRVIPRGIQLASAQATQDRKEVRIAGARHTTGLVVIVIDCDEEIGDKLRDPFSPTMAGPPGDAMEDPATWVEESPTLPLLPAPERAA